MAAKYKTRTPNPKTRPVAINERKTQPAKKRKPRRYIAAAKPTLCPECGHATRMDDGRHIDPVRKTILEYRTCSKCNELLAAGRPMTEREIERLCSRAQAVAEYEEIEKGLVRSSD